MKMLRDKDPGLDDTRFEDEFHKLRILTHPNIVRLIGYCYETHREYIEHEGVPVLGEKIYRTLCFEYLHNGSLQNHLSGMLMLHLFFFTSLAHFIKLDSLVQMNGMELTGTHAIISLRGLARV